MRFAPLTASYAITNFIAYSKRVTYRFKNTMEYLTQILAHDRKQLIVVGFITQVSNGLGRLGKRL
jgi:hypothetical protein